jgi:tetratricopeptide (TPR) repeat protein
MERDEEALEAFKQVTTLQPGFARAWHLRGVAASKTGREHQARSALSESLRLDPDNADARAMLEGMGVEADVEHIPDEVALDEVFGPAADEPEPPAEEDVPVSAEEVFPEAGEPADEEIVSRRSTSRRSSTETAQSSCCSWAGSTRHMTT